MRVQAVTHFMKIRMCRLRGRLWVMKETATKVKEEANLQDWK